MATNERKPTPPLVLQLADEPWDFDFWQAVRILQRISGKEVCADSPLNDAVEFTSSVSFGFPPSDVDGVFISPLQCMLSVTFMGLAGAHGPLPYYMTDELMHQTRDGNRAMQDFLDLFNHRLISLFYKAVSTLRPCNDSATHPSKSPFAHYLFSIAGLGTDGLLNANDPFSCGKAGIPDAALLPYVSLFSTYPRSVSGLETIIESHFKIPASIKPFHGEWLDLEGPDRTHLGSSGINNKLGDSAVLGKKAWDQSAGFTLNLGPLTSEEYMRFLPEPAGKDRKSLLKLVSFYLGSQYTCNVELELDEGEHLDMRLGTHGTAWLGWIPGTEQDQYAS